MSILPEQILIPSEASYLFRIAFNFARFTNNTTVVFFESEMDRLYLLIETQASSRNHCYRRKALSITYPDRVFVGLVIQHELRVCRITSSYMVCTVLPYCSKLSQMARFRNRLLNTKCVSIFSTTYV
jgi:hypothetical protein